MLSLLPWLLLAADVGPSRVPAVRATVPPVIDGRLDDQVWKSAIASDQFIQQWPAEGRPPSERTTLRILYDDEALYASFDCPQIHHPIKRRLTRRDQDSESEWVQLQLDTRRDGKTAFVFAVSVSGVLVDGVLRNQSILSLNWDENWEAQAAVGDQGWSAEMRIPLRILRFDSNVSVQTWGMQAQRVVAATNEVMQWSLVPRSASDWVARFGKLDDLRDLRQGGKLELRPFVTARVERQQATSSADGRALGLVTPSLREPPAGLDLKWHPTQDLTLDAAVLPEFGQVEADHLILNLTNYETFLPEKRPLFVEGAEAFSTPEEDAYQSAPVSEYFPNRIFYSRRIGSAPPPPALGDGERLGRNPQPSIIFGAGKLTGQLGPRYTLGVLSVLTGENRLSTNLRSALVAAPATSWNALRLRREFTSGHIGLIATGASRLEAAVDPAAGPCAGGLSPAPEGRCFHDAYVGGIDGQVRFGDGQYTAAAQVTASRIAHGPQRTLADGTAIGPDDAGLGLWTRLAKEGGQRLVWDVEYSGLGRRLDYNDVGFMARQNLHQVKAGIELHRLDADALLIEKYLRLETGFRRTLDGLDLGRRVQLSQRVVTRNLWRATLAGGIHFARFDDREIGNQIALDPGTTAALERARALFARLELGSDSRRLLVAWVGGQAEFVPGGYTVDAWAELRAHPLPQLDLELEPQFTYTRGAPRFAATEGVSPDRSYVFGPLLAKSAGVVLRANYTFTPRLTLQAYAQLFLASGHFDDLRSVALSDGRATLDAIAAAPPSGLAPASADFEQAAVNANLVLRWEYRLGAVFYLVYARSQIPTVDNLFGAPADLHLSALGHGGASDVVLLKLSYWWSS